MTLRTARRRLDKPANRGRAFTRLLSGAATPVALCLLLVSAPAAEAAISFEEGLARDPGSDRLLYREQHLIRREDGRLLERLVLYRCPDGTAFARKRVDYRGSAQAPAFSLEDARDGYGEGLRPGAGAGTVWVRERGTERSAALESTPRLVADAGFDEFIRRNWQPLLAGQSVPLRFAVPARLESLAFKVSHVGAMRLGNEPAERFRLRLGGWLGWIAPHIDVAYGRDSRRLLRFEGLSNLRADGGGSQLQARIEFPQPAIGAGEPQWRDFSLARLSACRVRA